MERVRRQGPDGVACRIRRVGIGSDSTSMFRSTQREGPRIWAAVAQLLRQPEMIAAEVPQRHDHCGNIPSPAGSQGERRRADAASKGYP
jgi:hypothetical protein